MSIEIVFSEMDDDVLLDVDLVFRDCVGIDVAVRLGDQEYLVAKESEDKDDDRDDDERP